MKNDELRGLLKKAGIKHWELAEELNISESTLCKRLRKELSKEETEKAIKAIEELKRGE